MKKLAILVMVAMLAAVGFGSPFGSGGTVHSSSSQIIRAAETSNTIVVGPLDNLDTAYAKAKAKSPTSTNRWTIFYMPGTYTRTSTYTWDTDCIDHKGMGANPDDVVITRGTGGATVTQTAADVRASNFTIKQTAYAANDHAFLISPTTNNTESYYQDMKFTAAAVSLTCQYVLSRAIYSTKDLGGTWVRCGDLTQDYLWSCASGYDITGNFVYCYGRDHCWFSESPVSASSELTGTWRDCEARDHSYGGSFEICASYGNDITGTIERCKGRYKCFGVGKDIKGTVRDCIAGSLSFAGGGSGTISGIVERNICTGSESFGYFGISGICRNNEYEGTKGLSDGGIRTQLGHPITNNGAYAGYTTTNADPNANVIITAKTKGTWANSLKLDIWQGTGVMTATQGDYGLIVIKLGTSGDRSANRLKTVIDAYPPINKLVTVTQVGDGTGTFVAIATSAYDAPSLSGGINEPEVKNNCTKNPIAVNTSIGTNSIMNGAIYTNEGATAAITITLPAAYPGLKYTFVDREGDATEDVTVNPADTDVIILNGTALDAGDSIIADNDEAADIPQEIVEIECIKTGYWQAKTIAGTWDDNG